MILEFDEVLPLPSGEGGVKAEKLPGGVGWVVLVCPLPDKSNDEIKIEICFRIFRISMF